MQRQVQQRLGDVVGLGRAARQVDDRNVPARGPAPAEVVAQPHRAGRVVPHRRDAAERRARAEREHGGGARREPVDPRAGGDRLARVRVDAHRRPVAIAADLLVGDRALEHEDERLEPAGGRVEPRAHELLPGLVGEQRVVDDHRRRAREAAPDQVLEARVARRRHRDRVAVAAEPARQPQHVHRMPVGGDHALSDRAAGPSWMRHGPLGQRRLALGQRLELVLEGAVQMKVVGRAGHEAGLREPLQRVRDRRPLGRDQLAEQAMGERQRQPDAGRLDPSPAGGQVPQQQDQANLEPRLGGDRPQDVELERAPAGAARQDPDDLRERPHAVGEVAVEHREPASGAAPASRTSARAADPTPGPSGWSRSPGPTSSAAVRPPTRISSASRPSRTSSPKPCPAASNQGARSHAPTPTWSTRAVASCRAAIRARTSNSSASSASASSRYV